MRRGRQTCHCGAAAALGVVTRRPPFMLSLRGGRRMSLGASAATRVIAVRPPRLVLLCGGRRPYCCCTAAAARDYAPQPPGQGRAYSLFPLLPPRHRDGTHPPALHQPLHRRTAAVWRLRDCGGRQPSQWAPAAAAYTAHRFAVSPPPTLATASPGRKPSPPGTPATASPCSCRWEASRERRPAALAVGARRRCTHSAKSGHISPPPMKAPHRRARGATQLSAWAGGAHTRPKVRHILTPFPRGRTHAVYCRPPVGGLAVSAPPALSLGSGGRRTHGAKTGPPDERIAVRTEPLSCPCGRRAWTRAA